MSTQRTFETAFIGKCRACKKVARETGTATTFADTRGVVYRMDFVSLAGTAETACSGERKSLCSCGKRAVTMKQIKAVTNDTRCDARCTHATGHSCECSCGGKNHGVAA